MVRTGRLPSEYASSFPGLPHRGWIEYWPYSVNKFRAREFPLFAETSSKVCPSLVGASPVRILKILSSFHDRCVLHSSRKPFQWARSFFRLHQMLKNSCGPYSTKRSG
jgi:hypothetical protein